MMNILPASRLPKCNTKEVKNEYDGLHTKNFSTVLIVVLPTAKKVA
jgi:hypothetical protein